MVYHYKDWTLYKIDVNVINAGLRKMYFFSKKIPKKGTQCDLPEGYEIVTNTKSRVPFLRYKNKLNYQQRQKKKQ